MAGNGVGMALITVGVAVGSAEYASVSKGHGFIMKPVIAGFGLGVVILLVYAASPQLGAALAWLIIVGSILRNGTALLQGAATVVSPNKKG